MQCDSTFDVAVRLPKVFSPCGSVWAIPFETLKVMTISIRFLYILCRSVEEWTRISAATTSAGYIFRVVHCHLHRVIATDFWGIHSTRNWVNIQLLKNLMDFSPSVQSSMRWKKLSQVGIFNCQSVWLVEVSKSMQSATLMFTV